jgi:phosphoribosylformylglycinamidine synthase subunit PurL
MSDKKILSIDFSSKTDRETAELLSEYQIGLTVEEARKLQNTILKRPATLAELILFGIEGSEHCSYKSSRPYLSLFTTDGPDVILGAKEDAGIVRAVRDRNGKGYGIVMSHESHNHPSRIVPYEGAATGVGGNVRDVCCMGAEVIAIADDLRFGTLKKPVNKWIYEGVSAGIAGYGNPIGVPNIGGGLQFDTGYDDNCLVTVVSLGVVEEDAVIHSYAPEHADGYDLILVGKPTDNSGFGGASFASFELDEAEKEKNKGAVQEPNAFLGRHMIKASTELFGILKEMDAITRVGFKDLGAGGVACASVELADTGGYGAVVNVDAVHTARPDFEPHIILCAETQERYMWVSPPDLTPVILKHYNETFALPEISRGAAASVIGKITDSPDYIVTAGGKEIVHAPASEVTRGFLYHRKVGELPAPTSPSPLPAEGIQEPEDYTAELLRILANENVADPSVLYEKYDKQVQGRTTVESGAGDAGVITPFNEKRYPEEIRKIGITLTTDQNPRQNRIDPYQGAVNAVVEAYCNTAAAGARAIALSDCLCYGNPEKPDQMRLFVEGCKGVADASSFLKVPVIAGNVSLYNESGNGSIPPSPMISILGKLTDADRALTPAFKETGSDLLLVGERSRDMGGSIYLTMHGIQGGRVPVPDLAVVKAAGETLARAAEEGLLLACHDISEGGAAAALCEMAISSEIAEIGCSVTLPGNLREDIKLFSESFGFILECRPCSTAAVQRLFSEAGIEIALLGTTDNSGVMNIGPTISCSRETAAETWRNGLRNLL